MAHVTLSLGLTVMNRRMHHSSFAGVTMGASTDLEGRAGRRAAILAAAERLINHYGFDKTTVSDIAKASGVGVGTVYLEFDSKNAIASELSRACHAKVLAAMRTASASSGSFAHRLRRVFQVRTEHFRALEGTGNHAIELVLHDKCGGISVERQRFETAQHDVLVDLLRGGHDVGELEVDDPKTVAIAVLRAYDAYAPPRLYDHDIETTARLLEATHVLLTRGLVRRS